MIKTASKTGRKKQPRRLGTAGKAAAVVGVLGAASAITVAARRARVQRLAGAQGSTRNSAPAGGASRE